MFRFYRYILSAFALTLALATGAQPARDSLKVLAAVPSEDTVKVDVPVADTSVSVPVIYTKEYLDTVNVRKKIVINDYTLVGFEYGFGMSRMMFNPPKQQSMLPTRNIMGVTLTTYGKMFGYMPYFGLKFGLFYGENGLRTKENKETGIRPTVDGAYEIRYTYLEVPVLAHFHIDFSNSFKLVADLGPYGGYKLTVNRMGTDEMDMDYVDKFHDYEHRFEYGIKGGFGFAIMKSPFEFFVTGNLKYAFSSLYEPDYYSQYYYRFAYPLDISITAGLHFQLTRRSGMTRRELRRKAREQVYGTE